jgi:mannose-6-phosphate isomerase
MKEHGRTMTVLETDSRELVLDLSRSTERLTQWAAHEAFPLWGEAGVDRTFGGFHEKIDDDGRPVDVARRARVQPRQVFAFGHATGLGWDGPASALMEAGLETMFARYQRADGLFRTLVGADGTVHDDSAMLYDQAFVLLALARAERVLGMGDAQARAARVRTAIEHVLAHGGGGYTSGTAAGLPLLANPHMHLLEACLDWSGRGDAAWDRIVELALSRMIAAREGFLREAFNADWSPAAGLAGRIVEPGHQFEWAWLLMRWSVARGREDALAAALTLIAHGERGVDARRNVAMLALLDDGSPHDRIGRLWAQTERIKAGCLAAELTGDARHLVSAQAGCESVLGFIEAAPVRGAWRDQMTEDGRFVVEPAPASSFYHLVVAIDALGQWKAKAAG